MKKSVLLIVLIFCVQFIYAQYDNPPQDIAPNISNVSQNTEILDLWDVLFSYPFSNFPISWVAETDGDYFYVGAWDFTNVDTLIRKYDMQGNFIENLYVPGATKVRDMTYDGTYFYSGLSPYDGFMKMDFDNQIVLDTIQSTFSIRALAYDDDLDVFYANNWSDAVKKFSPDGTLIDSVSLTGGFSNYYGFAYDNWSPGGPYLWGFSQNSPGHHYIVQMKLPNCTETGIVYDAGPLCYSIAGGLFTYPDYDSLRAVIGGINQNCCLFGLELAPISPPLFFEIGGNASAGTSMLEEGALSMYKMDENLVEDQFVTEIGSDGNYLFPEVYEGYYLLQAFPAPSSSYASSHIPTYLGGQIHWENVGSSYLVANSYDNNITLVEMAALTGGIGSVSGTVFEISLIGETPLPDAQVMLMNPADECVALSYTDSEGKFNFSDIALDTYGLLVEITGKTMEPMAFSLTEQEPELSDVLLYVSYDGIMVGQDEELPSNIRNISQLYPNPTGNHTRITIEMEKASELQVMAYTSAGQSTLNESFELKKGQNNISLDLQNLNRGVYYLTFTFDEEFVTTRKLIKIN